MELFKLFGTIAVKNDEAKKALDETIDKAEKTHSKISGAFKKIAKAGLVAGTAIGTAVAGITTVAVKSYAEYEQLTGGVEKLFGSSAKKIMQYSKDAYKNAGLSANEYMEQITGFSASLISSLGGDTEKAAKIGNMAINDMSDNVNVFGSNVEDVQNAYSGFAKQNYTMLDNLKLGYGGTKEEMQRLIEHANELGKAQGKNADLSINSYADVIEAIHRVQEEMNITGTTAKEAESTISGSIGMTKSAWENLMTGLADSNANIPELVGNVVSSASSVVKNVIPVVKEVLESIPVAISEISPKAGEAFQKIVDFAEKVFPKVKTVAETAFTAITNAITFLSEHTGLLVGVASAIGVIVAAVELYNAVAVVKAAMAAAEVTSVWGLVAAYAAQAGAMIVAVAPYALIVAAIAGVIAAGVALYKNWDKVTEFCSNLWNKIKEVFGNIKDFIVNVWNSVVEVFSTVFETIKNVVTVGIMLVGEIIKAGMQIIFAPWMFLWENCKEYIVAAWEFIKGKVSTAINAVKTVITTVMNAVKNVVKTVWDAIKSVFTTVLNAIKSVVSSVWNSIKGVISNVMNSIKTVISNAWNSVKTTVSNAINGVKSTISSGLNAAKSTVTSVLDGIKSKFTSIFEGCKTIVTGAISKIKGAFNFSWSLPKLKLPHPKISGKFSLNPPSVPKFSIEWYKKAMSAPMIMTKPTVFDYDPATGKAKVGGEAGSEVVSGTSTLMAMIRNAVAESNETLIYYLKKIIELLARYFPQIIDELNGMELVLDDGTLVGRIAPKMDKELGKIRDRKDRGR